MMLFILLESNETLANKIQNPNGAEKDIRKTLDSQMDHLYCIDHVYTILPGFKNGRFYLCSVLRLRKFYILLYL